MPEHRSFESNPDSALQTPPSRLLRNAAWMAWSGTISIANSVVLWAMYARWRATAELGQFTMVMGLYMIFVTISTLGLGPYLSSEIARRRQHGASEAATEFIASASLLLCAWSCVSAAAMCVAGFAFSSSPEVQMACAILSLAMLPTGLIGVAEPVCTALGRAQIIALAMTVENVLRTIVPLILLSLGCSLSLICVSFVGVRLAACLIYAIAARHHLTEVRRASRATLREIAAQTPTFAAVTILASLHFQAASVLIGSLSNETEAAQFGAASRFLIPAAVLLGSYVGVVQPAASRLAAVSTQSLGDFLARTLRLVIALTLPCAVGLVLLAPDVLTLLFSARLASAAPALSLLALSIVPFGTVMIVSRGLIATNHQRIDLLGNAIAVAVNLTLNVLLIPRYGATGAAATQLISMLCLLAVEAGYSMRRLYSLEWRQAVMTCAGPLLLMTLVVWQVRALGFIMAAIFGALVYLGGVLLTQRDLRLAFSRQ